MKTTLRTLSVLLCIILAFSVITPSFAADDPVPAGLTVTNPYENIDWDSINVYKTALHTHTNASDGDPTLKESIGRHAECGFDMVATTDHGTVNYSWETENANSLIHNTLNLLGRSEGELVYLGKEGTFSDGTSYTLSTSDNGDDYLTLSSGKTIMRVPYGIEQNAVSANAHVNSWFTDYHNNGITVYKDAVKNVDRLGGVCVINHPGEYSKARYEIRPEEAYNTDNPSYKYIINKFAKLLNDYDACIGIDINSKGDGRTKFDRKLWDKLLIRFTSNGKNVYAICSSDAHQLNKIDTGYTYVLAPEQTSAALKKALLSGEFIGGSHCNGNPDELAEIATSIKEYYGETDIYNNLMETYNSMEKCVEEIESGVRDADDSISDTYSVLDSEGYYTGETEPMITGISADSSGIKIETENALIVRWISNGNLLKTDKADNAVFPLSEYHTDTGTYVRAEVFGEGGFLYTQPFIISSPDRDPIPVIDGFFFDFGFLDCLFPIFKNWGDILSRMF